MASVIGRPLAAGKTTIIGETCNCKALAGESAGSGFMSFEKTFHAVCRKSRSFLNRESVFQLVELSLFLFHAAFGEISFSLVVGLSALFIRKQENNRQKPSATFLPHLRCSRAAQNLLL